MNNPGWMIEDANTPYNKHPLTRNGADTVDMEILHCIFQGEGLQPASALQFSPQIVFWQKTANSMRR
jgi:hypothetical protein